MNSKKEKIIKLIFTVLAFASLLFLLGIIIVLFKESFSIFKNINVFDFVFGRHWYPTYEPAEYGILPLIVASFWVTLGAMFVCIPLGLGSALYINELASFKQKQILKPIIEILAGIPSIVYGFFGMLIVAPFLQNLFNIPTGLCAFTASLVLGVMAIPTVASLSEDALSFVPKSFKEASYALGANRWQTLVKVIIPASISGISTSIILGMSRIVGETMTVLMVSGGSAIIPKSIFDPVRPMTSTIAAEMGESAVGSQHYHALFAIGLILFLITLIFNVVAEHISKKYRVKLGLNR
ncbi:MAG: phosphate ABC transporter permease subunit PstC [Endomicrobiia bacterium]|nr:phosphate ABC transporter permease subunit PstC [Endomicrobiaceae bacterium]MDD3053205.1 phosphate ABC transporter permease subunit PstC [Endomicrobiaceae bacterium]MDD3922304.1 phosphate ABC transporter permease subunit PstC [Endomicrobiaceae bacterium]